MTEESKSRYGSGGASRSADAQTKLAELARQLMESGGSSSLSTTSRKHPGYPFGSVVPYAITDRGDPVFLISRMATHTRNLLADPRATLLVAGNSEAPLDAARVSLVGNVTPIESDSDEEMAKVSSVYLAKHPAANQWVQFGDFGFFRMAIKDIYFIGGFGVMGWVSPDDYAAANIPKT